MADPRLLAQLAAQTHAGDVKALLASMPRGATRVRLRIVCAEGRGGCGKIWERKVDLRDPQASPAFQDLMKEARIHEALYEHRCLNATLEEAL